MFKVVYTKSLENADDIIAESWEYENKKFAVQLFNERVKKLINEILSNEFCNSKISIHKYRALITIESTHHCIAIVDDMNKGIA